MKIYICLFFFIVLEGISFGQQKVKAENLVSEGVAYNDKGDYDGAITKYNKALGLDADNLLALTEMAYSLLAQEKYDDAIKFCIEAIAKHPADNGLKTVYVTYGNALDGLKKTDKSIEIYDEGIKQFPDYYQLQFNKGITLASVKRYDEAIICLQKSIIINPGHPSSHNAIARMLKIKEKRIPAILAYCRFFVLEPKGSRAKGNLESVQAIMKGNVEQTGNNSININIDPSTLGDTTANGKPNENNFGTTDLILAMDAALDYDKKNKNKTEIEQFIRKFETVCASLKETKKDNYGFYWDYYVPYFTEMYDKKLIETFAYIAFASSDDKDVAKWLKSHQKEIDKFYDWSKEFKWKTN